ncbi:MAG: UDP-N-acetylmuramoyl-tripeptide--D-alanyl-D-alanine ligase, partial [Lachnospiraceae bacterium]|nr:UDP-N-acetylmuramoyl-tripeptide--D-alanyl-D-alanine ligase [Lachnospiraceae bacterium]
MEILTLENIASYCGGNVVNGDGFNAKITGAAIDSRKVEKGFIFFAYKGEKSDGHDYIAKAFELGAAIVVCERVPEGVTGTCIVVPDTIKALKDIARSYREQLGIKVVGVTGSVGKTTTKEFIASVLSQKYNVFRTDKNQNNLIGLPLSILNISENNEVAVLEMGISEFGEMRELSSMAKPDICVITNISACHLESLGSLDGVFKAKTEIFEHMNPEGSVVVCGDDERLKNINDVNGKKPVTYGLDENNDVHAIKVLNRGLWGSECTIDNGEGMFTASVPLPGKHMVINALCASAVGRLLEVSPEQIGFGISCVKALDGRNNIMQKNGITIIDDCYNASPESMKQSLELLTEAVTPTVAILGDMFEQGENEDKSHEEVGEFAVEKNIGTIACVGTRSKKMYDKAMMQASLKENIEVLYFATVDEAIAALGDFIKKDDTVLLKASNGMNFKKILEALTSEDNKDMFKERTAEEQAASNSAQTSTSSYTDTVKSDVTTGSSAKTDATSFAGTTQSEASVSSTTDYNANATATTDSKKSKKEKKVKTSDEKEKSDS